jgi:hypothetical protein
VADALSGGEKLQAALAKVAANLGPGDGRVLLRVGFLEGSTEQDGTPTPLVAFVNEFGATIQKKASSVTIYRKISKSGKLLRKGRFVKRKQSNYATTHATPAHDIVIPPRPFFRNAIAKYGKDWPREIATRLKANDFDARKTLDQMGHLIEGQIRQSITDTNEPPNAPSTVRRKKFNKPLVDTGDMRKSVDHEIDDGTAAP